MKGRKKQEDPLLGRQGFVSQYEIVEISNMIIVKS